jgi:hypothetical protein
MTTNGTRDVCAVVDAHVHLHGCYDPDAFFNHAYFNLASAAARTAPPVMRACYLLMTECESDDYFGRLHDIAAGRGNGHSGWLKRWKVRATGEPESLIAD